MLKLATALLAWSLGSFFWSIVALMVASNRVVTEGTCKLLGLVISDLVDEDYVKRYRTLPVAALMFGSANFLAKPGQALAPLVGAYLIYGRTGSLVELEEASHSAVKRPLGLRQRTNPS